MACENYRIDVCFSFCAVQVSQKWLYMIQLDVVVRSENCDAQANSMIQRRKLCSVHNFRRCF